MEIFLTTDGLVSLFTLTVMEIILGIDNIIFISIVVGKLPEHQQPRARTLGLLLALVFRILLLLGISWLIGLTYPVIEIEGLPPAFSLSWRDIILIAGGIFLMTKTVLEIHQKLEGEEDVLKRPEVNSFMAVVAQIIALDMVFSFDSILTAIGLVEHVEIMIAAVVIAMGIMMVAARAISNYINKRPTMKMLALSFLMLIGFMLVAEGFDQHVEKGYIYFAMAFAFVVELLNSRLRKKETEPVKLRERLKQE
ncbi:MAG: TerC family protein [Bacteroidetes bacterium]|nr:MAG: TerC family protein [Bacteroidota bacterium]